jgi:hypothetical protein
MLKTLLGILLSFGLWLALPAPVAAQVGTKAYAPEDIWTLPVPDRIRVIEREYAEQSSGRRIPDDQLEFYLDQIQRSRWTFSQVKNDISKSLGGSGGGWNPGPGGPPSGGGEILCESRNDRYTECPTPFRGQAMVSRQLSSTRCIDGVNFGSRPGMVWVRGGCRARFVENDRYDPPPVWGGGEITCESRNNAYRECRTNFRGPAVISRQLSSQACVEGRSWGNRLGIVWVRYGCRASFVEGRGGGGGGDDAYTVTCSSDDGRYRTCAWNHDAGRPRLIDQMSSTACIEGRTWGYDRREGLWVDRGCRGRFGTY